MPKQKFKREWRGEKLEEINIGNSAEFCLKKGGGVKRWWRLVGQRE